MLAEAIIWVLRHGVYVSVHNYAVYDKPAEWVIAGDSFPSVKVYDSDQFSYKRFAHNNGMIIYSY